MKRVLTRSNLRSASWRVWGVRYRGQARLRKLDRQRETVACQNSIARGFQPGPRGAIVSYSDPFVPRVHEGTLQLEAVPSDEALTQGIDCAVIATDHRDLNYADLARVPVIVDTRNALKGIAGDHIFRL